MNITNQTRLNMVIGHPLTHSQSPMLHNTVYQLLGLKKILLAHSHPELKPLIHAIKTLSVELTAVTMPFKEHVMDYLDSCSPDVEKLQSVNTILQRDGKLQGFNTDLDGIAFALKNTALEKKHVLVIGAGGTARTLGYFLKKHHSHIFWMNRTENKAIALAKEFGGDVISREKLNTLSPDMIINTTPIGLFPHSEESPLPNYVFSPQQIVFDIIYHPVLTPLLKQAQQNQATIISGLDMFIGQGLKQIELLTGKNLFESSLIDRLKKALIQNQQNICNVEV